jgi:hypothetical protein
LQGDERVIVNPPDSIIDGATVRIGAPKAQKPAKSGGDAS